MADRPTVIGASLTVNGDVETTEGVVLYGTVKGKVSVQQTLVVESSGVQEGDVEAEVVVISGRLTGNVVARSRVQINETGKMQGDLRAPRLSIAEGAQYSGHIDMGP